MPATNGDSVDMEKPEWLSRMETVLEVLNEGVVIADDHRRILFVNSRFVEMTGISLQELVGFAASHFYSSQEWDFLTQQIDVAFRAGHNRYSFVLPRKDGSRFPVIISSRTLRTSGSRLGIVTFTDIGHSPDVVGVKPAYFWAARLDHLGMGLLRLGLVTVLLWIGGLKFASYEADGIVPVPRQNNDRL